MSWLLPANRKLRHLEGISLRNLILVKPSGRPRRQTIDDESLPSTLTSPAKLLAQRDIARLEHSKSSSDLKASAGNGVPNGSPKKPSRQTPRRRSTLNWMDEPPNVRQKLLQDVVSERRPDTFFSLHRAGQDTQENPIYISELREKSMNPDFKFFDLLGYGPVSRDDSVVLRVWSRVETVQAPSLLVEAEVYLPSLIRIGKTLDSFYHALGDNAIIFHMTDGIYASFSDLPDVESVLNSVHAQPPTPRSANLPPRGTSSFDALMKLKDLAECIEDAEKTRTQVTQQIELLVQKNKNANDEIVAVTQKQASIKSVRNALEKTNKSVQKLKEEKDTRRTNLERRRAAIASQEKAQRVGETELRTAALQLDQKRIRKRSTKTEVSGQVRRIAQDILDVFPIEPIDEHPLCFTICSHFLPNAKAFEQENAPSSRQPVSSEDGTAAALGYVVQIVLMLEANLEVSLPYIPSACGSTSTIFDPLSSAHELGLGSSSSIGIGSYMLHSSHPSRKSRRQSDGEPLDPPGPPTMSSHSFRIFPLYQHSTPAKRFRWAIYLLNRDIEELSQQSGCRVLDPRNTLANLKFLLTVLASGRGNMPGRKVGIVRGLDGQ